jgi:hypothetical protein
MEVQWWPRRPINVVADISSFYQAMGLTYRDIEIFPKHLVVFLLSILKKFK